MKFQRLARTIAIVPFACLALGLPVPLPLALFALAAAAALSLALDRNVLAYATLDDARRQRLAESRRNRLHLAFRLGVLVAAPALVILSIAPSLSSEDALPDVSALKPFSAECNYMSREGYLIYLARQRGVELSRAEARRVMNGKSRRALSRVREAEPERVRDASCCSRRAGCACSRRDREGLRDARIERMRDELRLRQAARYAPAPSADARSRRAYEAQARRMDDSSPRYRGRRVAILPFPNAGTKRNPGGRVEQALARELQSRGYEVVALPHTFYHEALAGGIGRDEMRMIAERLGVDHVVAGRVTKYAPYKKVRLAGLALGGVLTGWHGYGDVALEGGVYSAAGDDWRAQAVNERTKRQMLGLVSGTKDLLDESLRRAATRFVGSM